MTIRRTLASLAVAGLAVLLPATGALATECVPSPGQEAVAPTYAVEAEYTRTIPATPPVLGEPPVITPGTDAWTEVIEHPAVPPVLGESPVIDPGQEYIAPTVECWGVYRHVVTGKVKTSKVDLGWGWVKIGTEQVTVDPGQPYVAPTYGEPPVIEPGVDAWTEVIEHDAVPPVLGEAPVITPGTPESTDTVWVEQPGEPEGDGWTATGNTRSGEGITRLVTPGQDAVAPVVCEPETPAEPEQPTEPEQPAEPENPVEPIDQGDDVAPVVAPVVAPEQQDAPKAAQVVQQPMLAETGAAGTSLLAVGLMTLAVGAGLLIAARVNRKPRRYTRD